MSCEPDTGTDFLSALFETQRMLRQLADKKARHLGMTRAQWAVLAKVERNEGQKQTELADAMEMAPISLTRLIDRLCDSGLIERRSDDADRRIKRLYLTATARPLMAKLGVLRGDLMQVAFAGVSEADMNQLVDHLETIKDNIRAALNPTAAKTKERAYEQVSG